MRPRPVGDTAWLLELAASVRTDMPGDARAVLAMAAAVRAAGLPVVDVVPAAATVLVTTRAALHGQVGVSLDRLVAEWTARGSVTGITATTTAPPELQLSVVLDGADVDETADLAGLTAAELAERVLGSSWQVAFGGFAPGFGYLVGGGLNVARLPTPRQSVPARSLALAGPYAAVYPRASPGGWRLVGRVVGGPELFDPYRDPPAVMVPGTLVRFVRAL